MILFFRDLALIPAMWRSAVKAERDRQYQASPEGVAKLNRDIELAASRFTKSFEKTLKRYG